MTKCLKDWTHHSISLFWPKYLRDWTLYSISLYWQKYPKEWKLHSMSLFWQKYLKDCPLQSIRLFWQNHVREWTLFSISLFQQKISWGLNTLLYKAILTKTFYGQNSSISSFYKSVLTKICQRLKPPFHKLILTKIY